MNELPLGWIAQKFSLLNRFRSASIDPASSPEETFELYSVPAFPTRKPELVRGKVIGSTKQLVSPGDVLICKINPRINRVWLVAEKGAARQIASSEWIGFRVPAQCAQFYRYYFASPAFREELCTDLTGVGGSLTRAQPKRVDEFLVPVAPCGEQQRIANKLDAVLARVHTCRDRLARVAPLLKRFRQSVLAAATSGRLTEDWRAMQATTSSSSGSEADRLPLGWRRTTFAEVCSEITVGFVGSMASQYVPSGIPFLRSMNVRAFRFDPKGLQFISPEFHAQIRKSVLRAGDLAIVRSGAPGVCCVVPDDLGEANCSDLVIARPGPQLVAAYGCIFMNSSFGALHVAANKVGVAQAHFNVGAMKTTPLPLPGVPEQKEIVRRVEILFSFADRLESRLDQAQTAVDRLTPSLLAKAFRGELVPQDPNDEPASELLRRLASDPSTAISRPGSRRPVTPTA